jgi:hypothetical protein
LNTLSTGIGTVLSEQNSVLQKNISVNAHKKEHKQFIRRRFIDNFTGEFTFFHTPKFKVNHGTH